ncbi:G2/mitotic-specific cyclin-B-like isoform X1 [Macrobrachium rosenbergii]|uniref:G2/mitotic-specific cyclin-B-like isoform X1 n=1 Tax=Macrobrachium rosenbergii TaxID=79674 RepID=UPI0034D57A2C
MESRHERKLIRPTIHEDNEPVKKCKPSPLSGQENRAGLKVSTKQRNNDIKSTMTKKAGRFSISLNIAKTTKKKKKKEQSEGDTIYLRSKKIAKRLSSGCSLLPKRRKQAATKKQDVSFDKHVLQVPRYDPLRKSTTAWKGKTPFLAREYEEDVMRYLLEVERRRHLMTRNYLANHPSVTQRTRAMLIDWLIRVQSYMELSQETLYQSINLIDRVLGVSDMPAEKVQLLSITAFFIVAKLEEKEPLEATDLLGLTLDTYTLQEFLSMEREVLTTVSFNLITADPSIFLEYFAYLTCNYDDKMVLDCANYLMETVLVEAWPLETLPSLLAAAALFGSLRIIHGAMASMALSTLMPPFFSLDDSSVISTSLRMLEALANRKHSPFQGASEKYESKSRHSELSLLPKLQPDEVLVIIDQVRATLISLRDANIIIRDHRHYHHHHHHLVNDGDSEEPDDETELRDVTDHEEVMT